MTELKPMATAKKDDFSPPPSDQLEDCLANLFQGPTKNLERAFSIILGMMKTQGEEHKKLQTAHEEALRQNEALYKTLRKEVQESHDTMHDHFEENCETFRKDCNAKIEDIASHETKFLDTANEMKLARYNTEQDISQLRDEIKVMSYNVQLTSSEADIDCGEELLRTKSSDSIQVVEEGEGQQELTDDQLSVNSGQDTNSEKSQPSELLNEVVDEKEANLSVATDNEINENGIKPELVDTIIEKKQSPPHKLPSAITKKWHKAMNGASVSRQKLQIHETLAARLDRIESDKEELISLPQDVKDLRQVMKDLAFPCDDKQSSQLLDVQMRVSNVEQFLRGFGGFISDKVVDNKDTSVEGNSLIGTGGTENISGQLYIEETDISISYNATSTPEDSIKNQVVESRGLKRPSVGKSDYIVDEQEVVPISQHHERSCKEMGPAHEKESLVKGEREELLKGGIEEQCSGEHANQSSTMMSMQDVNTCHTPSIKCEQNDFYKAHGLHIYMQKQESLTKNGLLDLSLKLDGLDKELTGRVTQLSTKIDLIRRTPKECNKDSVIESLQSNNEFSDRIMDELKDLRRVLDIVSGAVDEKVSKEVLSKTLSMLSCSNVGNAGRADNESFANVDEFSISTFVNFILSRLEELRLNKVDINDFNREIAETKDDLNITFSEHEMGIAQMITQLQIEFEEFKDSLKSNETRRSQEEADNFENLDSDLDERIKIAADAMESNLQEVISDRLSRLKTVEEAVGKLTSQLAEKPSQDQINTMIQDLENALSEHMGIDETFQTILKSIKSELRQKMTRAEVLSLVKQLLDGAKKDITNTNANSSLMVGCMASKCLGCNQLYPQGVNRKIAPKINHNALPSSRGLSPAVIPYAKSDYKTLLPLKSVHKGTKGSLALVPLQRSRLQGKRTRGAAGVLRLSRRRSSSLDCRRTTSSFDCRRSRALKYSR